MAPVHVRHDGTGLRCELLTWSSPYPVHHAIQPHRVTTTWAYRTVILFLSSFSSVQLRDSLVVPSPSHASFPRRFITIILVCLIARPIHTHVDMGPSRTSRSLPLALLALASLVPSTWAAFDCEDVAAQKVHFNLKKLGGPHMVHWEDDRVTGLQFKYNFTIDICNTIKRKKGEPSCHAGTRGTFYLCCCLGRHTDYLQSAPYKKRSTSVESTTRP